MKRPVKTVARHNRTAVTITLFIAIIVLGIFLSLQNSCYAKSDYEKGQTLSKEFYKELMQRDLIWLKSSQLNNGALAFRPMTDGEAYINPYFSCYTAIALITVDARGNKDIVKRYLDWHFRHLNTARQDINGLAYTIYDSYASVENGVVTREWNKKSYDSTDAYAALFLTLLNSYYEATGDKAYIEAHFNEIIGVLGVIRATMFDWLTVARLDHPFVYMMDNAEVLRGLKEANELLRVFKKTHRRDEAYKSAKAWLDETVPLMTERFESVFWNQEGGYYRTVVSDAGNDTFSWREQYPSLMAQVTPVLTELLKPKSDRAKSLYRSVCNNWNWEEFEYADHGDFHNGYIVYVSALMKDFKRAETYLQHFELATREDHAYPVYNADVAFCILACDLIVHQRWQLFNIF